MKLARRCSTHPSSSSLSHKIEILESRIAPAADVLSIGGLTSASFTDADGDLITIHISGTAGSVDLGEFGGANGTVDDGEAIGTMAITGTSADFVLTVSVNSTGSSNGIVELGTVTSEKSFFAFNTVADTTVGQAASSFDITNFTGPGFTTGGGLYVDKILDGSKFTSVQDGVTIAANTSIAGRLTIDKPLAGAIVAGSVTGGLWETPSLTATSSIVVTGDMSASVETGAVAGDVNIGGSANNEWIVGAVASTASLQAGAWADFESTGTFAGKIVSTTSAIVGSITGSLAPTASFVSAGGISLDISGSVPAKATLQSESEMTLTLGGSFAGRAQADGTLNVFVPKGTVGGVLASSGSLNIDAKSISKLEAMSDSGSSIVVAGNITNSQFFGGDSEISLAVVGNISKTLIVSDEIRTLATGDGKNYGTGDLVKNYAGIKGLTNVQFETSEGGVVLTVLGNVSGSTFNGGSSNVELTIGGNLSKSKFTAAESDISLTVAGNVSAVQIAADDEISLNIGGALTASDLNASDRINIDADKSITGVAAVSGDRIQLETPLISKSQFSAVFGVSVNAGSITGSEFTTTDNDSSLSVTAEGAVSASRFTSGDEFSVSVDGSVTGSFFKSSNRDSSVSSLAVTGAVTKSTVTSSRNLVFASDSLADSTLSSQDSDVTATIAGSVKSSRILAEDSDVTVTVGGTATGLIVDAATDVTVTVAGDLVNSRIFGDEDGDVFVNVTKNVVNTFVSNGSSDVTATVGGDVIKSRFFAEESDISATVGGNIIGSTFGGSGISVSVAGNLTSSRLETNDSTLSLAIEGALTKSTLVSAGGITLDAAKDVLDTEITVSGSSVLDIDGNFKGTLSNTSSSLRLTVGGDVLPTSKITNVGDTTIAAKNFDATLNAGSLDFLASGNVGAMARIQAAVVADSVDADLSGFKIGGTFGGRLSVSGNFAAGEDTTQTVVGGDVLKTARISVGGIVNGAATQLIFGGAYAGTLLIAGDLSRDLSFAGDVNSITIGGSVVSDVVVTGKITRIVTGSLFTATDANDGNFTDGAGTTIGTIDTTAGHGLVISTI